MSKRKQSIASQAESLLEKSAWHRQRIAADAWDSGWHRLQLKIYAIQFADLFGYQPGSDEADVLMACVLDGADFAEAMETVLAMKLKSLGGVPRDE